MEELHTFFAALTGLISLSKSLLCTSKYMEELRGMPEAILKVRRSHAHMLHDRGDNRSKRMQTTSHRSTSVCLSGTELLTHVEKLSRQMLTCR